MSDRGLPASPEAERSILGACLLDGGFSPEVTLTADDFFLEDHRKLYTVLREMEADRIPIDPFALLEELGRRGQLDAKGATYISTLPEGVPRGASLSYRVQTVRSKALARAAIHAANAIVEAGYAGTATDELIQKAQSRFMELALESSTGDTDVFVDVTDFCQGDDRQPNWLVEGFIEQGSNGIIAADPKGGKSVTTACLAVCLALGIPWLNLEVKRRARVALVSREDNPETTARRIRQITRGKGAHIDELRGWIHVNSKAQTPSLMLDNPREVANLIRCIKRWGSEFVIFDVLNKLHVQDENDNTKVRAVMNQVDRIQAETGAQACVLHHWNKGDPGQSLTRRLRGAGAIAGFAEWIAGIELEDEQHEIRKMSFETKVGSPLPPIYYRIEDNRFSNSVSFKVLEAGPEPADGKEGRKTWLRT